MGKIDLKSKVSANSSAEAFSMLLGGRKQGVQELPIDRLIPYENQPFRPYPQEKLIALAEDIRDNGVLSPILVRQISEEEYQILAGHNRVNACKLLGMETVPGIIKAVDDNQAALIMLNTNLNQRDKLLPSEKAFAYKMQMEAMKQQGKRTDLGTIGAQDDEDDLGTIGAQVRSRDIVAAQNNTSREQIRRFIRLTYLIRPLLDRVDNGDLPFRAGVNLSYLTEQQQDSLLNYVDTYNLKISLEQSDSLKEMSKISEPQGFQLSKLDEVFDRVQKVKAPPSPVGKAFKAVANRPELSGYFEGKSKKEIEEILVEAIKRYFG